MAASAPARTKRQKPVVQKRPRTPEGKLTPLMMGPVGPESAALRSKYPALNSKPDVALIQYYLGELVDLQYVSVTGSPAWVNLCLADPSIGVDQNFVSAIRQFQKKVGVTDAEESSQGIIKPDGQTLMAMVDIVDYGEKLTALRTLAKNPADYIYYGSIDVARFQTEFREAVEGRKVPADYASYSRLYDANLGRLLGMMAADPYFIDIRWMAYVLATVGWETGERMKEVDDQGKAKFPWRISWAPVEEGGHGKNRLYGQAVKVLANADGSARVTLQDGTQWGVDPQAKMTKIAPDAGARKHPEKIYADDAGKEFIYYGRGYVQLTWWDNYAKAGVKIGKGISLLTSPDEALKEQTAYDLMSYCLRTGYGFAHGNKLGDFICGAKADYRAARIMVNLHDRAEVIANMAGILEGILLDTVRPRGA